MSNKDKIRDALDHLRNGEQEEAEQALSAFAVDKAAEIFNKSINVKKGDDDTEVSDGSEGEGEEASTEGEE